MAKKLPAALLTVSQVARSVGLSARQVRHLASKPALRQHVYAISDRLLMLSPAILPHLHNRPKPGRRPKE